MYGEVEVPYLITMRIIKENNWVVQSLHMIRWLWGISFMYNSHLVPVVVPAIGASNDDYPVFPFVRFLGRKCIHQPETQAEQDGEDWRKHVLFLCVSPGWKTCTIKISPH